MWRGRANLDVGQEAIFFLQAHPTADFYTQISYGLPLAKSDPNYETERKAIGRLLKIVADPHTALLAEKAADRQFAACALLARYRTSRPAALTTEPIPADESKRILEILAEMKWSDPPLDANGVISLPNAFWSLQLTEKDGWQKPEPNQNQDANEVVGNAASKWIRENAGKYRIERLVAKPSETR